MNIDIIKLLVFAAMVGSVCYLVGYLFLTALRVKLTSIHFLVSPVLGLALLAVQLWVCGLVGISWSRWILLAPWFILLVVLRKKVRGALPQNKALKATWRNFLAMDLFSKTLVVMGTLFALAFIASLALEPVITSDVLAIWGLKAKEFFFHRQVFVNPYLYETVSSARFYHVDYPPLLPLMADVFYVCLGHVNEGLFKLLQSLFLFSGATGLFVFVKNSSANKREGLQIASIAAFLVLAAPQFLPMLFRIQYMGYADYPLGILMLISVIFLTRFLQSENIQDWWLSLGFASFAGVTKNEGIPFLAIVTLALFALRFWPLIKERDKNDYKKVAYVALGSLLVLLPTVFWTAYKQKHSLAVDFKLSNFRNSGMTLKHRVHLIVSYIWLYISTNPAFHWESAAIVLATLATLVKRSRTALVVAAVIWAQLGSYMASYIFSPYDLKFHVLTSIDRLLTQVLPLVVLLLAINLLAPVGKKSD